MANSSTLAGPATRSSRPTPRGSLNDHALRELVDTVTRLREEGEGLRHALRASAVTQQAVGILMERHELTSRSALQRLRSACDASGRSLEDVAGDVVAARSGGTVRVTPSSSVAVSFGDGPDRLRLQSAFQRAAVALATAGTPRQLVEVVRAALAEIGAAYVALHVAETADDHGWLDYAAGHPEGWLGEWRRIPPDSRVPMVQSFRDATVAWLACRADVLAAYPGMAGTACESLAVLPLSHESARLGVLTIGWDRTAEWPAAHVRFAAALAALAARSLHRIRAAAAGAVTAEAYAGPGVIDARLHPAIVVQPVRDESGRVVDFEVAWANEAAGTVLHDASRGAGGPFVGGRLLELYPGLAAVQALEFLREAVEAGAERRLERIALPGPPDGLLHHRSVTVHVAPVPDGLLVGWIDHEPEERQRAESAQQLAAAHREITEQRERATRDRIVIEAMQRAALPEGDPASLPGLDVAARYLPVLDDPLGGDWYDVFAHEGRLWLAVGDVAGHGVAAAAAMSQLRNAARGLIVAGAEPPAICESLNRLALALESEVTATCVIGYAEPAAPGSRDHAWTWSCAGHPAPVTLDGDGHHRVLPSPKGLMLGVDPAADYEQRRDIVAPLRALVLLTDGLFEEPGEALEDSLARLMARVSLGHDADATCESIIAARAHQHRDDACFLVVQPCAGPNGGDAPPA